MVSPAVKTKRLLAVCDLLSEFFDFDFTFLLVVSYYDFPDAAAVAYYKMYILVPRYWRSKEPLFIYWILTFTLPVTWILFL